MTATKRVRQIEALPEAAKPTEQQREQGMKIKAKRMYPGLDIELVYMHFNQAVFSGAHPEPINREAAFIAYVKKKPLKRMWRRAARQNHGERRAISAARKAAPILPSEA